MVGALTFTACGTGDDAEPEPTIEDLTEAEPDEGDDPAIDDPALADEEVADEPVVPPPSPFETLADCVVGTWRMDQNSFAETMQALMPGGLGQVTSTGDTLLRLEPSQLAGEGPYRYGKVAETFDAEMTITMAGQEGKSQFIYDFASQATYGLAPLNASAEAGGSDGFPVDDIEVVIGSKPAVIWVKDVVDIRNSSELIISRPGFESRIGNDGDSDTDISVTWPGGGFEYVTDLYPPEPVLWAGAIGCVGNTLWLMGIEDTRTITSVVFDRDDGATLRLN